MKPNVLEIIAKYEMTEKEASAFKVGCMYDHLVRKIFPGRGMRGSFFNGDPRKKLLFKYAWKLINEYGHQLDPSEYKLYIFAQLKVLKANYDAGHAGMFLTADCLVGHTAWNRWLVFKNQYQQRTKFREVDNSGIKITTDQKTIASLMADKAYFQKRFGRLEAADIETSLNNRTLLRWITMKH